MVSGFIGRRLPLSAPIPNSGTSDYVSGVPFAEHPAQVECRRKLRVFLKWRYVHRTGGGAEGKEARSATALGFVGIHRKGDVVAAAGMSHVVGASSHGAAGRGIHDVKDQRRVDWNRGMQARGRLPRPIA